MMQISSCSYCLSKSFVDVENNEVFVNSFQKFSFFYIAVFYGVSALTYCNLNTAAKLLKLNLC